MDTPKFRLGDITQLEDGTVVIIFAISRDGLTMRVIYLRPDQKAITATAVWDGTALRLDPKKPGGAYAIGDLVPYVRKLRARLGLPLKKQRKVSSLERDRSRRR